MRTLPTNAVAVETIRSLFVRAVNRTHRLKRAVGGAVHAGFGDVFRRCVAAQGQVAATMASATAVAVARVSPEPLENRQLMSGTAATFKDGLLSVTGDATAGTSVLVALSSDHKTITGSAGGKSVSAAVGDVKGIVVTGGSGTDFLHVDNTINIPATISGGDGNDTVEGGAAANTITVGNGNALIRTRGTANSVKTGNGNVRVYGGSGNDTITTGTGADYIEGGDGNDLIDAGSGNDSVYGNNGNDTLKGELGNDSLHGGLGDDYFITGGGNDSVYAGSGNNVIQVTGGTLTLTGTSGNNTYLDANGKVITAAQALNGGQTTANPTGNPTTGGDTGTGTGSTGTGTGTGTGSTGSSGSGGSPTTSAPNLSPTYVTYKAAAAASGGPQAVLQVMNPAAMVGAGVVVRGLDSVLGAGSDIDANYQWDFGDHTAGATYNTLDGFNAAHVYDTAGTYTISLTVTNVNGKASTATATVNIGADTRRKIYVNAATGNDANDGSTPDKAVKTADRAAQFIKNGTELLFARGQTHNLSGAIQLKNSNILVGAYGTGAQPVVNFATPSTSGVLFTTNSGAAVAVTVQDLRLTCSPGTAITSLAAPMGFNVGGYDMVVRRNTIDNVNYVLQAVGSPVGLSVIDNVAPAGGTKGYFLWGAGGSGYTVLGNTVGGSIYEHAIRTSDAVELNISQNTLANYDGKGVVEIHRGGTAWIDSNDVKGGPIRVGPRGGDSSEDPSTTTVDCVIQRNVVTNSSIQIDPGSHHIMVRNNAITVAGITSTINIVATDSDGRQVIDARILNNTGYSSTSAGQFLKVIGTVQGVQLVNNLYVSPTLTVGSQGAAPVFVYASSLAGWTAVTNNVWQTPASSNQWADGGINFVATTYVASGEMTADEWNALSQVGTDVFTTTKINTDTFALGSGATAATAGKVVAGVYGDLYDDDRPTTGSWSAGAVQA